MLKLAPPSEKRRTPFYYVIGTYLGIRIERSTGTAQKRTAGKILTAWQGYIARGEVTSAAELPIPALALAGAPIEKNITTQEGPITFVTAVKAYLKAGGERYYLNRIIEYRGPFEIYAKELASIDQLMIDNFAEALYPNGNAATKNRNVYTPISAVLKHAGLEREIRRPKGWRGSKRTFWLEPAPTFRLLEEAERLDLEFGIFCTLLNYCGLRLSEGLSLDCSDIFLDRQFAYLRDSKNGDPRPIFLPTVALDALQRHPRGLERSGKLFRFHAGGRLRDLLFLACENAKIELPRRTAFHVFCHNYGTWMHHYGKLDTYGLVRTGRWRGAESADRYRHTEVSEESRRASLLPVPEKKRTA